MRYAWMLGVLLCVPRTLWATPSPEEQKAARQHYEAGTAAYNLGEFLHAAEEYRTAYKAVQEPVILYNIAQAYRLGNDLPQALFFYRSYLRNSADPKTKSEVEKRIKKLEEQIAAQQKAVATAPPIATPGAIKLPEAGAPETTAPETGARAAAPGAVAPRAATPAAATPGTAAPATAAPGTAAPATAAPGTAAPATAAPGASASERMQPITDLIKSKRDNFRSCFDQWARKKPGSQGKLKLVLYVKADGTLDKAEIAESTLAAPDVTNCMIGFAKTLTYPKSPSGKLTKFSYPFEFKSHLSESK